MNLLLSKRVPVAERVKRLCNSFKQDIIYNMSFEKNTTIKLVQLSITTKRKTESRPMLDSLNVTKHHFVYTISYDEVNNAKS